MKLCADFFFPPTKQHQILSEKFERAELFSTMTESSTKPVDVLVNLVLLMFIAHLFHNGPIL